MRKAADFRIPLKERVEFIQKVLEENPEVEQEVERLNKERDEEFEKAKKESKVKVIAEGKIAVVVSKHRFATNLGYQKANIVVAFNPEMPVMQRTPEGEMVPTGKTYEKYTIVRLNQFVPLDIEAIAQELNELEKEKGGKGSWSGRADILGSPLGESSKLSQEEILEVVKKHLKE
jgi:hypothetical protein